MEVSSNSRTVKGLSIAVLVLSILGLIVALAGFAICGLAMQVTNDASDYVVNQLDESGINDSLTEAKDALENLSDEDLELFSAFLDDCDVNGVNKLGTALKDGDEKTITKQIVKLAKESELSKSDRTELIDALCKLNKSEAEVIGETLEAVDKNDLQEIADTLDDNTKELVNAFKTGSVSTSVQDAEKDTIVSFVAIFLSAFIMLFGFGLLGCVFSLVASILGIRNYAKPDKLKAAFVWSIIAAILAFCVGRIVSMILLIIMAVYINKVRKQLPGAADTPSTGAGSYGSTYATPAQPVTVAAAEQPAAQTQIADATQPKAPVDPQNQPPVPPQE